MSGWASKMFKVASAVAATVTVADALRSFMRHMEAYEAGSSSGMPKTEERTYGAGSSSGMPNTEERTYGGWTKPMVGWVKLNVDGSLLPHSAGCGGVLRDASGNWIAGFAKKLSPTSRVDETVKEAILKGLQWAMRRAVRKVAVESDNLGVVYMINSGISTFDPLICEIRKLLNSDSHSQDWWQATLTTIPRQANQVADKVAYNSHALLSFDLHEFDSPPENCLIALSRDAY